MHQNHVKGLSYHDFVASAVRLTLSAIVQDKSKRMLTALPSTCGWKKACRQTMLEGSLLQTLLQVFEVEQAPPQDGALSVEPVRKGRELSERINALIADLRRGRAVYPQCFVVRQGKCPADVPYLRCMLSFAGTNIDCIELCVDMYCSTPAWSMLYMIVNHRLLHQRTSSNRAMCSTVVIDRLPVLQGLQQSSICMHCWSRTSWLRRKAMWTG